MITAELLYRLLAESDLFSVSLTVGEDFATRRPLMETIGSAFGLIGRSLTAWLKARSTTHVFVNARIANQTHVLSCDARDPVKKCTYAETKAAPPVPSFRPGYDQRAWRPKLFSITEPSDLLAVALPDRSESDGESFWIAQFDFSNGLPLGHFCVVWDSKPEIEERALSHVQEVLWSLAGGIGRILRNQHSIHESTYLPGYSLEGERQAGLLFADIRNSTPFWSLSRVGGAGQLKRAEALVRAWLEYSVELISIPAVGRIQRFTGDGLLATFGEYGIDKAGSPADARACVLALSSGRHLVTAFTDLYSAWRAAPEVRSFFADYNEDTDLKVGVGINYGSVYFGYLGSAAAISPPKGSPGEGVISGHIEYTVLGDHVNTAQRLEGLASRRAADVDLSERGERFRDEFHLSSLIISQTAWSRLRFLLGEEETAFRSRRGVARVKGKGDAPFFEVSPSEVDITKCAQLFKDATDAAEKRQFAALTQPPDVQPFRERMLRRMSVE